MSPLPKRQLGKSGPHVSAIGFGTMGLSASYGKVEENEARFAVLDRALELGTTFWDSSDVCMCAAITYEVLKSCTRPYQSFSNTGS
jgi:aryl-alcohol dehydrogenase-like predicted oxidoreductase